MNYHYLLRKDFGPFLPYRGDPYQKNVEIFFSTKYDTSLNIIHTPIVKLSLVEICCFQIFSSDFWPKKAEKQSKNTLF
jgi:hypothetical protein